LGTGKPAELPGDWPCFRGKQRDNLCTDGVRLARSWPSGGPPVLWALDVGEGYAGAAVWSGRVFLLDYDREHQADALRCLSLADGAEIWRYSYPVPVKRYHGMSRTVPAVTEKYVVALGPKCHVTCLESASGKFLWSKDLVAEFGTVVPEWYAGQCPLIEDDKAILAPGGDALLVAVDCATGKVLWRTPNPRGWDMTHSSVAPMSLEGRRVYVYSASGGVVGVSGETGEVLWETDAWTVKTATVATPVPVDDERLFLSGGYGGGSMMLGLKAADGKPKPEPLFRLRENVFGAAQQTPILYENLIYGVRPNGELACLDLDGKVIWTSGAAHRFGLGPFLIADGVILVLDESGKLTLAEASSSEFKPLAQAQVLHGHDAWGPMALAGGRLILRDLTRMVCLDVAEPKK
jgi:outer membrane protein assembly factor BamB